MNKTIERIFVSIYTAIATYKHTQTHTINKLLLLYITKKLKLCIFNFLDFSLCPITYKCINSNENMFR